MLRENYEQALDVFEKELEIRFLHAERVIPGLSDAQARLWQRTKGPYVDPYLTALKRCAVPSTERAVQAAWKARSLVDRLSVPSRLTQHASAEAVEVHAKLTEKRKQLAQLASITPRPDQLSQYQQLLVQITASKESLEKQLAALNPQTERMREVRSAGVPALASRLPEDTAIIMILDPGLFYSTDTTVTLVDEAGETEQRKVKKLDIVRRYEAFVIRSTRHQPAADDNGTQEYVDWIQLGDAYEIDRAIGNWRNALVGDIKKLPPRAQSLPGETPRETLHRLVWTKLQPHLAGCRTVVVLPSGRFGWLPWGALPGKRAGSFLIEDYAFVSAAHGSQIYSQLLEPEQQPTAPSLLVVGGVDFGERPARTEESSPRPFSGWSPIDGTAKEVQRLVEFWGQRGELCRLTGLNASEAKVIAEIQTARFAHLATHGYFDAKGDVFDVNLRTQPAIAGLAEPQRDGTVADRNPLLLTGMVLSNANLRSSRDLETSRPADNGIVTAEELVGLDLSNLDLVTLSACESGLGLGGLEEGMLGLRRSFHRAGVRSVLASLWKVDDEATTELMIEFYRNLWQRKLSKSESLRQAQLSMIRGYNPQQGVVRGLGNKSIPVGKKPAVGDRLNPFYWASFQLSGDWR